MGAGKVAEIQRMRADGVRPTEIARQLKVGRTSVYKYLDGVRRAVEQLAS